jgi:sulfoacetaldehyde dehydrogenase
MAYNKETADFISGLVERSRKAQAQIEFASQEQVDDLVVRITWAATQPDFARKLADFATEETRMGIADHKYGKIMVKVKGALRDMKGKQSVGVVAEDKIKGYVKIAKPMGVVGALVPCTIPEAAPFVKALSALKTRNSIVLAPHPRSKGTNKMAVDCMREVLKTQGFPEDLVIGIDDVSVEASEALMAKCDIVMATGGSGLVKAAYSSGTPAQGVGAGNTVCIVDETADIEDATEKIIRSKTFDHATSCSTENSIVIQESVYDKVIDALKAKGGYLVSSDEKDKLQNVMWEDGHLSGKIVCQSAQTIAKLAGLDMPEDKTLLMVEETGIGVESPFSGEKLSPVSAIYKWKEFSDAIDLVNNITTYSGPGHSCGIHTTDEDRINELGKNVRVSRVVIRQPQCLANSGAWTNSIAMSTTLGCGSWGGNSVSENVTWKHLLNYTWIYYEIPSTEPSDEELFGSIMNE